MHTLNLCTNGLTWDDARKIFRLVGEVCELGRDLEAWRAHLIDEACRLVGAKVGFVAEAPMPFDDQPEHYVGFTDRGWGSAREREVWLESCAFYKYNPTAAWLSTVGDTSFTITRQCLADDDLWYRSTYVSEYCRAMDLDHFVISNQAIVSYRAIHVLQLNRAWKDRPFSRRERAFVAQLHHELALLWQTHPPSLPRSLPTHLRRTLLGLCRGHSEKTLAAECGLSQDTVHDYTKAIYRRFDVHSRAELLARMSISPAYPWLELGPEIDIHRHFATGMRG